MYIYSQQIQQYPKSKFNISIFGTQSSGKSTLLNNIFNTNFHTLNTLQSRQRCTTGIWLQNVKMKQQIEQQQNYSYLFNILDTQGFDSLQRHQQQKILEKQISLFCLIISDIVIINLWMNQIGRYQATHIELLKDILKLKEKIVENQQLNVNRRQRRIMFVIKDCQEDVDLTILQEQLEYNVNKIMKEIEQQYQNQYNNNLKNNQNTIKRKSKLPNLSITYHFISHFHYNPKKYHQQSKQLKNLILQFTGTKSIPSLSQQYTQQQNLKYIKQIWNKIKSQENQINLKDISDALRRYKLERIKKQILEQLRSQIQNVKEIRQKGNAKWNKSFRKFLEVMAKQAESLFYKKTGKHLQTHSILTRNKQHQQLSHSHLSNLTQTLTYLIYAHFTSIILPYQQTKIIKQLQLQINNIKNKIKKLQKIIKNKRNQAIDKYKQIIKGFKEQQIIIYIKIFNQKIDRIMLKYQRQISHNLTVFQLKIENQIVKEINRQLSEWVGLKFIEREQERIIKFRHLKIDQKIKQLCQQYSYTQQQIQPNLNEILQKIKTRIIQQKLPQFIQQISLHYNQQYNIFTSDRQHKIIVFYKKLQNNCQQYLIEMINYLNKHQKNKNNTQLKLTLDNNNQINNTFNFHPQQFSPIKQQINKLLIKSLQKQVIIFYYYINYYYFLQQQQILQKKRFKITLIIISIFMWLFYNNIKQLLKYCLIKKRKRNYILNFYLFVLMFMIFYTIYNERNKIKKYLGAK